MITNIVDFINQSHATQMRSHPALFQSMTQCRRCRLPVAY
jgi:hypothetical protein